MSTKQNLELKHYCNNFPAVRDTLTELGATKEIVKHQKDHFFDLPAKKQAAGARLKLRIENDTMTLVYYERPDFVAGEDTTADIALLPVDQATLDFLTTSLGVIGIVEKEREVWRKDHTVFHLDTVEGVGQIFEIEVQCDGDVTPADKELFASYQATLSPLLGDVVTGSNIDLVQQQR